LEAQPKGIKTLLNNLKITCSVNRYPKAMLPGDRLMYESKRYINLSLDGYGVYGSDTVCIVSGKL
jgi:hypothetical protein